MKKEHLTFIGIAIGGVALFTAISMYKIIKLEKDVAHLKAGIKE